MPFMIRYTGPDESKDVETPRGTLRFPKDVAVETRPATIGQVILRDDTDFERALGRVEGSMVLESLERVEP